MKNSSQKTYRGIVWFNIINLLLLAGIFLSVLMFWQPWDQAVTANTRKITVTGTATVEAEPNQFQFSPRYTKDSTDEITKLNDQIVATLKNIGVEDSQIKNNASRYGSTRAYYIVETEDGKDETTLSLTITVDSKDLAQKVQDYLITTNPSGSITPYASFSTTKEKELQDKARGNAIKDARKKAQQTADGLGVKIGKVITVSEGSSGGGCGYGSICPVALDSVASNEVGETKASITVQPGTDEYTYSFTVVFALE